MTPPIASSAKASCGGAAPIDLKPFLNLPDQSQLAPKDLASKPLQEFYQKVNAYFLMDIPDYGIGNGDKFLDVSEVDQFFAKYPSNDPKVNTCSLMDEARFFAQIAPTLTEAFLKKESLAEKIPQAKKEAAPPPEKKSAPLWQILLGAAFLGWIVKKTINRFRSGGPKDGGTSGPKGPQKPDSPKTKTEKTSLNGSSAQAGSALLQRAEKAPAAVPLNGDLTAQIQHLYGGAKVYVGAGAQPGMASAPSGKVGLPVALPLVTPAPLTLPVLRPVPVVRPVPVIVR